MWLKGWTGQSRARMQATIDRLASDLNEQCNLSRELSRRNLELSRRLDLAECDELSSPDDERELHRGGSARFHTRAREQEKRD
jgi:hypothetical protein